MSIKELIQRSTPVRRRLNGTLFELTAEQKKQCDSLCIKRCCNYYNGNCLLLEESSRTVPCLQILSRHVFCRWFQNAVLPSDWKLEGEIFADEAMKMCISCGASFISRSGKVKYCPHCRTRIRREKTREYVARHRVRKAGGM